MDTIQNNSKLVDTIKQESLSRINSLSGIISIHIENSKEIVSANAFRVKEYLKKLEEENLPIGKNFTKDESIKDLKYCHAIKRINFHLGMIKKNSRNFRKAGILGST